MKQMNPEQDFFNAMGTLWRSQPVPPAPAVPCRRAMPLHYAATLAGMILVGGTLFSCAPQLDISGISAPDLFQHAEVSAKLTSILTNK